LCSVLISKTTITVSDIRKFPQWNSKCQYTRRRVEEDEKLLFIFCRARVIFHIIPEQRFIINRTLINWRKQKIIRFFLIKVSIQFIVPYPITYTERIPPEHVSIMIRHSSNCVLLLKHVSLVLECRSYGTTRARVNVDNHQPSFHYQGRRYR